MSAHAPATGSPDASTLSQRVAGALGAARGRRRLPVYPALRWGGAVIFAAVVVTLLAVLLWQAAPAFSHSGWGFFFTGTWNPTTGTYGAGVFIIDTLITTALAMAVVIPIGIGTAAILTEYGPRWLSNILGSLIELLAAVPSIVVGLWALLVLTPLFTTDVEPFFKDVPVLSYFFRGPAYGSSLLLAGVVLAVMTLPTMVALTRTALRGVAVADREAARALGATKWQVIRRAVIPGARSGITAAITLAMGRALGEAIAVALVIGAGTALPHSLLSTGSTLGSAVVNFFSEATDATTRSAIIGLVVILLVITALVNVVGQLIMRRRPTRDAVLPPGEPEIFAPVVQ